MITIYAMSGGIVPSFVNNRNAIIVLIGVSSCLICVSHQAPRSGRNKQCGTFEWFDSNVNACGHCRELCDNWAITRTEVQCKTICADYLIATSCTTPEQYYDENIGGCGTCLELCRDSTITRTADECQSKCKAYLEKTQHATTPTLQNNITADQQKMPISIIAVIGVSAVCACGGIILIVVFLVNKDCTCCPGHKYKPARTDNNEAPLLNQPIQETQQQFSCQAHN